MKLDVYTYSNPGGRASNEDAIGSKKIPGGGRFVLADGLEECQDGAMASLAAVTYLLSAPDAPLQEQIEGAHQELIRMQKVAGSDLKSTAVLLNIANGKADWAHVGDSRLYYLHRCALAAVTEDHSVAYQKYKEGKITRAQIPRDEAKRHLLRTLGSAGSFQPDTGSASELEPGDGFLLCSDGVWEYLRDEEILVDQLKSESAQTWGELLLLRVMERMPPGSDNLSLIAILLL